MILSGLAKSSITRSIFATAELLYQPVVKDFIDNHCLVTLHCFPGSRQYKYRPAESISAK